MKLSLILAILTGYATANEGIPSPVDDGHQDHAPVQNTQWKPVDINGKSYIPLEQLKNFYFADKMVRDNKEIRIIGGQWQLIFRELSQVTHMNGVKFMLSEPIRLKDGTPCISQLDLVTLVDPVLRPAHIANAKPFNTVIIDPGHGGKDKGAAGIEAEETLKLAKLLQEQIVNRGLKCVLTREKDEFVPLADRVKMANAHDNAILISLHYNSGNRHAHGFETYVMSARVPAPNNKASIALATATHSRCITYLNKPIMGGRFNIEDRGIKRARFNVLSGSKHPTVYIEAGFLSHKEEAIKIRSAEYRKTVATGITTGILVYHNSIKKGNRR